MDRHRLEARRWFGEAEADLATAVDLVEKERFNWACFVAQQAAEKAVKAVHLARGEGVEKVHSVLALIGGREEEGISRIQELRHLRKAARELDKNYIPARYPNGVPFGMPHEFYGEENGRDCVEWARTIIEAVRSLL
jgi:HEPN domain-containing protein